MTGFLSLLGCLIQHDIYEQRSDQLTDNDGDGISEIDGDCDDQDPSVSPVAKDTCDQLDNDCDGDVDEDADMSFWYIDADGDGYGDGKPIQDCEQPVGTSSNGMDCDDTQASINPGVDEVWYNGVDEDCSGSQSDYDADDDGEDSEEYGGTDCDDSDSDIGAKRSEGWFDDGTDNDCDGQAGDPLTWQVSDAKTSFIGTIPDGELGRRVSYLDSLDCLLMSALFADVGGESSGVVYAASGGESGEVFVDTLGQFIVNREYSYLSSTLEGNSEGVVALSGPNTVWLLDAASACTGETVDVEEQATLILESTQEKSYFGLETRWLTDYRGTGSTALAIVAPGADGHYTDEGAVYIWENIPSSGIVHADDADTVYTGSGTSAALYSIESVLSKSGTPELLITQGTTTTSDIVVARVEAGAPSGSIVERMEGGLFTLGTTSAPSVRIIGDVDRDGDVNIVSTAYMGLWNHGDIVGVVDVGDAPSSFGWEEDGEWVNFVEPVGDIDGDGRADMLLLSDDWPAQAQQGTLGFLPADAWLQDGLNRFENLRLKAIGSSKGDSFAYRVTPVQDFDRDGVLDVAVSAYGTDDNGASSGTVYLVPIPVRP